jgi:hypothetical protein
MTAAFRILSHLLIRPSIYLTLNSLATESVVKYTLQRKHTKAFTYVPTGWYKICGHWTMQRMGFEPRISILPYPWRAAQIDRNTFPGPDGSARDITPCSPLKVNRRFGGTYRLYLLGRRINQARNQREAGSKQRAVSLLGLFFDRSDVFLRNVGWVSTDYTVVVEEMVILCFNLHATWSRYWTIGILCRFWGFHSGGYEEYLLLGYEAV